MTPAPCQNRLGAEYGEDNGPCGDEGRVCEACQAREAEYWRAYFGAGDFGPPLALEEMARIQRELK